MAKDQKKNDVPAEQAKPQAAAPISKSKGRPAPAPAQRTVGPSGKELRGIVRLAGRDIKGDVPLMRAIVRVKGMGQAVGIAVTNMAFKELNVPINTLIGELSEQEMQKIEHMMTHPVEYGVPV
ncbi:MAG TPA: hypothetical protein PLO51_05775, partial [Candidatus Micrarchaeota archaeon]|nr:hypothetical protein [Candidatus Micrarchaeota archaeon]